MPTKNKIVTVNGKTTEEDIKAEKSATLKMKGLILKEQAVIYGMEKGAQGVFIPAKMNDKNEFDRFSSAITLNQMKSLKGIIENNIKTMIDELNMGNIEAIPTETTISNPCDYCKLNVACGHKETDRVNYIKNQKVSEMLGGEQNELD